MQGINERRFQRAISLRNDPAYIRARVAFRFLLLFGIGILLGGELFRSEYIDRSLLDASFIEKHFESIFVGCETFFDKMLTSLVLSKAEISYLILIFISGFTYFCFIASGLMILVRGFLIGFSTSYLVYLYRLYFEAVERYEVVGFVAYQIVSSIILICLSVSAYIFSFDFRDKRNNFALLRSPIIFGYVFAFIIMLGGLLMNSFLYCLLLEFLKA